MSIRERERERENASSSKSKKSNLDRAKIIKNDEFYTQLTDIEKELKHYKEHFKDKVVYCNCDDPEWSNFYFFFEQQFEFYGLKKLITTHYSNEGVGYKLEIYRDENGNKIIPYPTKTPLKGNGDFRSEECIQILKEADIVCTNPPFSLFREYIAQLVEYNKQFLIIGSLTSIGYKDIFPLIKNNKIWLGYNNGSKEYEIKNYIGNIKTFIKNEKVFTKMGNTSWLTNLTHKKRNDKLVLYEKYSEEKFPKYDNYDAINVDKTNEIPKDYDGYMGVPITFLDKYNPEQFEIIRFRKGNDDKDLKINNKSLFSRIIIKRKE